MLRFTTFTALVLFSTGLSFTAEAKEKPPQISACAADVCLTELRWTLPDSFVGTTEPAVDGVLVNNSGATLSFPSVRFALEAVDLLGTGSAYYSGAITPGGRWHFHASFSAVIGGRFVMNVHTVALSYTEDNGQRVSGALEFDPLFAPVADGQRKAWEKIHGKRQR